MCDWFIRITLVMTPLPLIVLFIMAVFAAAAWDSIVDDRRRKQNFNNIASQLNLGSPEISDRELFGNARGKRVRFTEFSTGSGKTKHVWAEVAVAVRARGLEFSLRPENLGTKLIEMIGWHDVKTGDADFDRRWRVDSNIPDLLHELLLDEFRTRISQALSAGMRGEYRLESGWMVYRELGHYSNANVVRRMEAQFPLLCDLTDGVAVVTENGGRR